MSKHRFRMRVQLDPQADQRELLEAWPSLPLQPDFIVVASGWVAFEIGGQPLLYREGIRITKLDLAPMVDPLDLPEARIGDYIALFLLRLLDTTAELQTGRVHLVHFVDNPACLTLRRAGACIRVSYRESRIGPDIAVGRPIEEDFRVIITAAAGEYIDQLLTLNPALAEHPDVIALGHAQARLEHPES